MKLDNVKYTKEGRPYVEFGVKSGKRAGSVTRRFGKILKCPGCEEKFFARDEQIKKGIGKFCSINCAKKFTKEANRKREVSGRRSKEIKGRLVYFGEDGKIYAENKDSSGKIYRYYGEIRKCSACGGDFFAEFSQIKRNRAKFCSRQCVKGEKIAPQPIPKVEAPIEIKEEVPAERETEPAPPMPAPKIDIEKEFHKWKERRMEEEAGEEEPFGLKGKPIGVLVFGIIVLYIGLYHIIAGLREYAVLGLQLKSYGLALINILLGLGILRMKSWSTILLYVYLAIITGGAMLAYYFAIFINPSLKTLLFSRQFIGLLCLAFIPYMLVLVYLTHPYIKEQFK